MKRSSSLLAGLLLLSLCGCMSSNLEDAMAPAGPVSGPPATDPRPQVAEPELATLEQMTDEELEAWRAEIEAAGARQQARGGNRQHDPGALGRLARSQQEEALRAIEGE